LSNQDIRQLCIGLLKNCILKENQYKVQVIYNNKMIKKKTFKQVHKMPEDLQRIIDSDKVALKVWGKITPLARNEWICWIESAKKPQTRSHRIDRTRTELREGKHRPCCWSGCPHR
jgi:uncharacterized protein YdeI (YjbR/CyaY-like superfamily)